MKKIAIGLLSILLVFYMSIIAVSAASNTSMNIKVKRINKDEFAITWDAVEKAGLYSVYYTLYADGTAILDDLLNIEESPGCGMDYSTIAPEIKSKKIAYTIDFTVMAIRSEDDPTCIKEETYKGFAIQQPARQIKLSNGLKKVSAGKSFTLKSTVLPKNTTNKKVTWTSGNKKYATVSASGKVTTKKAGIGKTVKITATVKDGSSVKASYTFKIVKGVVKKITINGAKSVKAGKTFSLKAKVTATKGANRTLKWTSSNKKYATVTSSGKVKALKAGKGKTVKITAAATDGSGKKKTVIIKIK